MRRCPRDAAELAHEARELALAGDEEQAGRVSRTASPSSSISLGAGREDEARLEYRRALDAERLAREGREAEARLDRELAREGARLSRASREEEERLLRERAGGEVLRLSDLKRDLERKLDAVEARDDADDAESVRRLRIELRKIELELDRLDTDD